VNELSLMTIVWIMIIISLVLTCWSWNKTKDVHRCPDCGANQNYTIVEVRGNERDVRCKSCGRRWTMTKGRFEMWLTQDWMKE
jgi:predicted Zn finger-like uncharacterized protein